MVEVKNTATRSLGEMGENLDARWWMDEWKEPSERARRIQFVAREMWQDQQHDRNEWLQYERLYGNAPILGLGPQNYRRRGVMMNWSRLSFNGIKSVVDTWVALVTNDRPKCTALTDEGDWALQQKAHALELFHDGVDHELDFHQTWTMWEYDTAKYGVGWLYFYIDKYDDDHWQPACERVLPGEMLIDARQAMYGWKSVRQVMRIKWVDKLAVIEEFPEKRAELMTAGAMEFADPTTTGQLDSLARYDNMVPRICAWSLPTRKGAGDGLCVQVCGNVLLEERPFTEDCLPFEPTYRKRPGFGVVGGSMCDELRGPQKEMNTLVGKIQRSHHLLGAGHWLIEQNSNVNTNHMDNQIGSMVRYKGTPPQFVAVEPLPQSVYSQVDKIWMYMHQTMGISLQTAQGEIPANIHSAKGQLVYAAAQDKRFQTDYREAQSGYLRAHRQFEILARQISEKQPDFMMRSCSPGPGIMEAVRWKDAAPKDLDVSLHIFPTNSLSNDPEGRIEQIQQLANAGWLNPRQAMRALNFPDLQSILNEMNSSWTAVQTRIDLMMRKGDYRPPEPTMDLVEAVQLVRDAYNRYSVMRNCPKGNLRLLLRWMAQAKALPTLGAGAGMAGPAAGQPAPPRPTMSSASPLVGGPPPGTPQPMPAPQAA